MKRNIGRETVAIGNVHPVESVGTDFHVSMVKMFASGGARRVAAHIHLASGANITSARNNVVKSFLAVRPKIDWLWMVDADMRFDPDVIEKLVASADPEERPIVGALCFALDRGEGSTQEIVPTIYTFQQDDHGKLGMVRWGAYPRDQLVLVAATGAACILMHRSVLEAVGERWAFNSPWCWYQEVINDGQEQGEDVQFCLRAQQAGFPIWVDTSIKTGHTKPFVLDEGLFLKQFTGEPIALNAEEVPTFVVLPVKNRLDLTRSILEQLKTQGGYHEILVFDNGSTDGTAEYLASQDIATAYDAPGAGIYQLWNEGIREAQRLAHGEPCNIAILNNDLELGDGFLDRLARGLRSGPTTLLGVCGNYDGRAAATPVVRTVSTFKDGGFGGFAFMVKGEAMGTTIPYFDEGYIWYFGDDHFVHEVQKAGAWLGLVIDASVVHIGGGSQTSSAGTQNRLGTRELQRSVEKDMARFMSIWGASSLPEPAHT